MGEPLASREMMPGPKRPGPKGREREAGAQAARPEGPGAENISRFAATIAVPHPRGLFGSSRTLSFSLPAEDDVGLLALEVDPVTGEPLGNFPQAFSHIGLVRVAWAIAQAEGHAETSGARPA